MQTADSTSGAVSPEEHPQNIHSEPQTLAEAIHAYKSGLASYLFYEPFTPEDGKDALAERSFHRELDTLVGWDRSAASADEAALALTTALSEGTVAFVGGTFIEPLMRSALGFIRDVQEREVRDQFDIAALRDDANRDPVVALARRLLAARNEGNVADEAAAGAEDAQAAARAAGVRAYEECYDRAIASPRYTAQTRPTREDKTAPAEAGTREPRQAEIALII